jgi:hypothetical protein
MDRRDALKKLGMGGATAVGASMIVSSPAFAADGTPTCGPSPGSVSITGGTVAGTGNTRNLTITVGPGTFTCLCRNPPIPPTVSTSVWSLNALPPNVFTTTSATWNGLTNGTRPYAVTVKLTCPDSAGKPVCSSAALTGNIQVAGASTPTVTPTAGQTFAPATC